MRSFFPGPLVGATLGACLFAIAAQAQDAAILRQNTFEVGPFGGISYGVDNIRGMGGANATYSILPNILLYGEYSDFPSIERSIVTHYSDGTIASKYILTLPLQDVNFGAHVRFRIPKTPLVPYGVIGVGLLHSGSVTDSVEGYNQENAAYGPAAHNAIASTTSFAVNYGAGVRWYIRESFGLRGEFKAYSLTGGPLHSSTGVPGLSGGLGVNEVFRATVGFFFQF
jgi:hypothetical protein